MTAKQERMLREDGDSEIVFLRRELRASMEKNDSLKKENQELRQEVARLKVLIGSLKAHDNERKSMLWKKIHNNNTDMVIQKSPVPSLQVEKLTSSPEIPKPPPKPLGAVKLPSAPTPAPAPAPPPPPLPSKLLGRSKSIRRVPEVMELYRLLTRKGGQMENRKDPTGAPVASFSKNMIGEIENRSSYLSAIKSDVETRADLISYLIKEVESAAYTEISEVEAFVKWLDEELSSLVDERAVLKHFPHWPERKADAMREAACSYRDLKNLESEVSSFRDNAKEPCSQALRRMQTLQDRLEQSVSNTEKARESTSKKYKDLQIPWGWMMDTGMIGQIKLSSMRLAKEYMRRVTNEMHSNDYSHENILLQGVKFAFRVHQFAGGFDAETIHAFEELKKVGMSRNNRSNC